MMWVFGQRVFQAENIKCKGSSEEAWQIISGTTRRLVWLGWASSRRWGQGSNRKAGQGTDNYITPFWTLRGIQPLESSASKKEMNWVMDVLKGLATVLTTDWLGKARNREAVEIILQRDAFNILPYSLNPRVLPVSCPKNNSIAWDLESFSF